MNYSFSSELQYVIVKKSSFVAKPGILLYDDAKCSTENPKNLAMRQPKTIVV